MARNYAQIQLNIWRDPDFLALSEHAKFVYFLVLSQPTLTHAGVTVYMPARWARYSPNGDADAIANGVAELVAKRFVMVDYDTDELLVRSFIKHNGVLGNRNLRSAMVSAFGLIHSQALREAIWNSIDPGQREGMENPRSQAVAEPLADGVPEPLLNSIPEPIGEPRGLVTTDLYTRIEPKPETETKRSTSPRIENEENLVERLVSVCDNKAEVVRPEAAAVVSHLRRFLDDKLIDECIGVCIRTRGAVKWPRYLVEVAKTEATKRGIRNPPTDWVAA